MKRAKRVVEPTAQVDVLDTEIQVSEEIVDALGGVADEEIVLVVSENVGENDLTAVTDRPEVGIDRHPGAGEVDPELLFVVLGGVAEVLGGPSSPARSAGRVGARRDALSTVPPPSFIGNSKRWYSPFSYPLATKPVASGRNDGIVTPPITLVCRVIVRLATS